MRILMLAAAVARTIGAPAPYEILGTEWDFTVAQPNFEDGYFKDPRQVASLISGTVTQSIGKFGEPCIQLQTGSRINYTQSSLSLQGDFTIEGYYSFNDVAVVNQYLLDVGANGLTLRFYGGFLSVYNGGTAVVISDVVPVAGQWYHLAVVRNDGVVSFFIDGVKKGQGVYTNRLNPTTTSLGNYGGSTGFAFRGKISQFRIVLKALYSEDFMPPQEPWSVSREEPAYDPHFNSVNFLVKADSGAVDLISGGNLTSVGGTVDTTVKRFGQGSLKTGVSGSYIYSQNKEFFDFGSDDFTMEAWVYPTQVKTTEQFILGRRKTNNAGGFKLSLNNMRAQFSVSSGIPTWTLNLAAPAGTDLELNKWHHVAACRSGGHIRLYVNGVCVATSNTVISLVSSTLDLAIGSDSTGVDYPFIGNIDSIRVTRGVARYQGRQFTPRITDFAETDTPVTVNGDPYSSLVSLAVRGIGRTESGTEMFQSSAAHANQPLLDNTLSLFDQPTLKFTTHGTSAKALKLEAERPLIGSAEFTIESWFNTDYRGASPTFPIVAQYVNGGAGQWMLSTRLGKLCFWYSSTLVIESDVVINDENWHHVAVVRKNGIVTIYLDGVSVASGAVPTVFSAALEAQVGYNPTVMSAGHRMNLSRLRVTNGVARYTGNFVPGKETVNYGQVSI